MFSEPQVIKSEGTYWVPLPMPGPFTFFLHIDFSDQPCSRALQSCVWMDEESEAQRSEVAWLRSHS